MTYENIIISLNVWRLILAPIIDNYPIKSWMMLVVGVSALVGMVGIEFAPASQNDTAFTFTWIIAILHVVSTMPLANHEYYEWRQAKYGNMDRES